MGCRQSFIKSFGVELKNMYHTAVNHALKVGFLHPTARQGVISLIPKKGRDRNFLVHWRPITLLNVDYKILSKALANKMKIVLPTLIHEDQTGFLSGRSISENIRKMCDVIDFYMLQNLPALVVSVDFAKAFDRVDYNALYAAMCYFNFPEEFIEWTKVMFKGFSLQTVNNGNLSEPLTLTRGLFQGNPQAPYLFLIVIEVLAQKLQEHSDMRD